MALCNVSGFVICFSYKVCLGPYDAVLIKGWEDQVKKHDLENDHSKLPLETSCLFSLCLLHL